VNKEVLKHIIISNQQFLREIDVESREFTYEPNGNYVIVGPRRVGKTYALYNFIKKTYAPENILYINFEDERLIELRVEHLDLIIQSYQELYPQKPILFFDEIQNVAGWEKFARRLADTGYRIYITGSNARLLSKEIATTLGGRFLIKELHPLDFKEYLQFNNFEFVPNFEYLQPSLIELRKQFNTWLNFGGLPETLHYTNKKEYLSNLYQKVFYGDILSRYSIKNDFALKLLVKKIAESVCNETSFNRFKNNIISTGTQVGTNTLIEYFGYLNDSFLVYNIGNFQSKFSERESKRKFYFSDTGILNLFLIDQPQKLLENAVFIILRKFFTEDIYYFQKDFEVDFYIPDRQLLIQVSLTVADYDTRKREITSMKKAMNYLNVQNGLIITLDETDTITEGIFNFEVKPLWKWVLDLAK
jgi:uncharacterized protein